LRAKKRLVIAIDGPAGSGKSTTARLVANMLEYTYLDTGAMYRALAWKALKKGVSWEDGKALARLARGLPIRFVEHQGVQSVLLGRTDVTQAIRTPEMDQGSSKVSVFPEVRRELVAIQRRLGIKGGVVIEGRDTTSVVFPGADLKIFLTASLRERAKRRQKERAGSSLAWHERDLRQRDKRDTKRAASPLTKVPDAVWVNTSSLTINDQVKRILHEASRRVR
jgi:cytidylate kinase